jgi:hypothetical protein
MATVHFAATAGALLTGWMPVRAKRNALKLNRVIATDLSLLVLARQAFRRTRSVIAQLSKRATSFVMRNPLNDLNGVCRRSARG